MEESKAFDLNKPSDSDAEKGDTASAEAPESAPRDQKSTGQDNLHGDPQLPAINFATFIFSLNSSALVQLGIMDDPVTGKKVKNLLLAKQTIDILGMLHEKTRGNLVREEEDMLNHMLYDLRILYVKEKK